MHTMHDYLTGVIEGFFGRSWAWQDRADTLSFLSAHQLSCYIYAPKEDPYLRRQWDQPWPADMFSELASLSGRARKLGVKWGLGLSPLEAWRNYDGEARQRLQEKVAETKPRLCGG